MLAKGRWDLTWRLKGQLVYIIHRYKNLIVGSGGENDEGIWTRRPMHG